MITGIVRSISVAVGLGLVLVLASCASGFNFNGTWKGNRNLAPKPGEHPGVVNTLGQVTLKVDRVSFSLTEAGIPHTGTVRYDEGKAYLKVESRLNVAIANEPKEIQEQYNREIVLTPLPDGTLAFDDPGGFFEEPLALKRQPE